MRRHRYKSGAQRDEMRKDPHSPDVAMGNQSGTKIFNTNCPARPGLHISKDEFDMHD